MNYIRDKKNIFSEKWVKIAFLLVIWDITAIHASYFLALWLRFDCRFSAISSRYLSQYYYTITLYAIAAVIIFRFFRLYNSVWRYASVEELIGCVSASVLASLLYALTRLFFFLGMPRSYHVFGLIIQVVLIVLPRFGYRFYLSLSTRLRSTGDKRERIMIIGAGSSGQMLLKDIKNSRETNAQCVCLIDDDPQKQGRYIEGVKVVGGRDEILKAAKDYEVEKIFLSIPRASAEDRRDILNICKEAYKGDKLLQRQPPKDFLTKKPDKTKPYESFYLKNDHEPIVEPKVWNAVQKKIKQNMDMKEAVGHLGGRPHFLYGKVFCADCGSPMTRRTFTGYKGVKYKAWVCSDRHLGRKGNGCQMRIVKEDDLTAEICQQMNWKTVTEARMAKIDRVEVKADGVEVVRS